MEEYLKHIIETILKLAKIAARRGEVPVGAVIVEDGRIIAGGFNSMERDQTSLAHAEMKAIRAAQKQKGAWRLDRCDLYVTLEPCVMCSGAIYLSRIRRVYFLLETEEHSFSNLPYNIEGIHLNNHKYRDMLQQFFQKARRGEVS